MRPAEIRVLAATVIMLITNACSIAPRIEQVTGVDTWDIVRGIRCEMREAVRDKVAAYIKKVSLDALDQPAADLLLQGKETLSHMMRSLHDAATKAFIRKYANTAIVYEFTIDITEGNVADATVDVLGIYTHRTTGLDFKASNDRSRQNVIHFYVTDYFAEVSDNPDLVCDNMRAENYMYPIAGRIGVYNQMKQFLDINESQNLSTGGGTTLPTYTVTYNFQTTISGSTTPKINVVPLGHGQHFQNLIFDLTLNRKDFHKVVIAIAFPLDGKPPKKAYAPGGVVLGPLGTASSFVATSSQAARAYNAIQDTKVNQYLTNRPQ